MALEVINARAADHHRRLGRPDASNNTKTKDMKEITPGDFSGRYIHYGIREHGMAAAMNGMALHGGVIPYGGTFLMFSDYCRPSIRLAALMGIRVIFVMTHDSIGLGEDGPTHQPVEHLAALARHSQSAGDPPRRRAWRRRNAGSSRCEHKTRPSLLALSRQDLPTVRTDTHERESVAPRAPMSWRAAQGAKVTFLATGSEVELALKARELADSRRHRGARRLHAVLGLVRGTDRNIS